MSIATTKYAQYIRFDIDTGSSNEVLDFEGRNITVGFEETRNDFKLINGNLIQSLEHYRFFCNIQSPYLRFGPQNTYSPSDFVDIINHLDDPSITVELSVPEYSATKYEVVKGSSGISVATNRQRVIPEIDYTFRAKNTDTSIPSWMFMTKPRPGYLTT